MQGLEGDATALLGVGLAPGVTNLLARRRLDSRPLTALLPAYDAARWHRDEQQHCVTAT